MLCSSGAVVTPRPCGVTANARRAVREAQCTDGDKSVSGEWFTRYRRCCFTKDGRRVERRKSWVGVDENRMQTREIAKSNQQLKENARPAGSMYVSGRKL